MLRVRPLASRVAATRPAAAHQCQAEAPLTGDTPQSAPAPAAGPPLTAARHDEPRLPGFEPTLTAAECARLLGVSTSTLQVWRALGKGPAFVKLSRRTVRYQRSVIAAWLSANQRC